MITLPVTDPIPYSALAKNRKRLEDMLPLPMPLSLHADVCNICNMGCRSCPQFLPDYKEIAGDNYRLMDVALYEKIIRDVVDMGRLKALKLFGYGEPMLHPGLPRMVSLAKESGATERVEFTSNCTRLTERMAEGLIAAQLDYLRVSIYSIDQKRHEEFTGSKVSIDQIYENVARLRRMRDAAGSKRPYLYVKMFETTTPEDEQVFRDRYGPIADELALEVLHNMSGIGTERLGISIPQRKAHRVCPLPFYMAAISANGIVTICCIDYSYASKVGDIKTQSLREIWKGPELRAAQLKMLTGRRAELLSCKDCTWDWNHPDAMDGASEELVARFA